MMKSNRKKITRNDWLITAGLIVLSIVPALGGTARVIQLASGAAVTPDNARFFAAPLPVLLHIFGAIIYSFLGALQFAPGIRHRWPRRHRVAGWFLVPSGLIVALSGLWMARFYPWPAGDGELLYGLRLVFGTGMLLSILLGVAAIRRRDYVDHGAWMLRGYAIGLGAGTQVFTHVPWFILFGVPGELLRAVLMAAGWVINIVVAEWIIYRRRAARKSKQVRRPRLS